MSRVLTANEVCERALRDIGAFPISDSGADGEDLREAMYRLDLILAEIAGTANWLMHAIPAPLSMTLNAGQQTYVLSTEMGSTIYPGDGVQMVISCWIEDSTGNRDDVSIINQQIFEGFEDPDEIGKPAFVYIDREVTPSPTLKTFPTLDAAETETYTLKLLVQTFAPNVSPGGVSGTKPDGSAAHGFRPAWQRYLIYRLAADCARGAVRRLPQRSIDGFDLQAEKCWDLLQPHENVENDDTPPISESHEI